MPSFSSSAVVSSKQYSESLEKTVDVGANWIGLFFGASSDYKKKTTVLDSGSSVYILSGAECNSYFSKMNNEQPPKITGDFINAAKDLETLNDTYDFFREYGTHLSLIHISEPTRRTPISYAVFCLKKKKI